MYSQTIYGMPQLCPNRLCKTGKARTRLYREGHKGYLTKSEAEIFAVVRCMKCQDTFRIVQLVSMANEYYEKLPRMIEPGNAPNKSEEVPISFEEMAVVQRSLNSGGVDLLRSLNGGMRPGNSGSLPPRTEAPKALSPLED